MSLEISFKSLFEHLIRRWYLMVAFGLLGALTASLVVALRPTLYQAQAVVMVDQQVELALPPSSQMDDVLYVSRETVRLEDLTYADSLWEQVYAQIDASRFESELSGNADLRQVVNAPHYQDGNWYFIAEHSNPEFAVVLANTWAESFVETVQTWVETAQAEQSIQAQLESVAIMKAATVDSCDQAAWATARALEIIQTTFGQSEISEDELLQTAAALEQVALSASLQTTIDLSAISIEDFDEVRQAALATTAALEEELLACQVRLETLQEQEIELIVELENLAADSFGVSPYLRIQVSQLAQGPIKAQENLGTTALIGFMIAVVLWLMAGSMGFMDIFSRSDRGQA